MDIVQNEDAFPPQRRDRAVEIVAVKGASHIGKPVQQALFVLVGLKLADDPGAGIGKGFVIEVDRVLSRKHQPNAKGARLFEHAQNDGLAGWVGDRRQVAHDLVK